MVHFEKGDYVWIPFFSNQTGFSCPIGARIVDIDNGRVFLRDDDGNETWLEGSVSMPIMHPSSVQGVEDMIELTDFHDASVLRNLQIRYKQKLIYATINPYQQLPIYSAEMLEMYGGKRIGELAPHVFAVAENAYMQMMNDNQSYCIIISGESGAGKTETAKLVLQHLAVVSSRCDRHSWIEQQILEANPILEAFGNAKTVRNDNSSRFGRYIDMLYNDHGMIESARIEQYLLEKSRLVSQSKNERNFHIFYCMLAGMNSQEKAMFELEDSSTYFYLSQGKNFQIEGREDESIIFRDVRAAMKVLFFSDIEIMSIFKLLAAILHIGNIRYTATLINNLEATEITTAASVLKVAKLLQVDQMKLINALTTRTISLKEETVVSSMTAEQSLDVRDALAKAIYGRLFTWIVDKINFVIKKVREENGQQNSIGILDIYGFEQFQRNSFEQFCINYANESLQQFFIRHSFKLEQEEYAREQIKWTTLEYIDNQPILDLIAYRSINLFGLLDEESRIPKGTDQSFLTKAHQAFGRNRNYIKPKSDLNPSFGVVHYAGSVMYHNKGFVEKNRDALSKELLMLLQESNFPFVAHLFSKEFQDDNARQLKVTTSFKFRKSLETLMAQIDRRKPYFIRCIKPNDIKKPMLFDRELCYDQLKYLGLMDTIQIRKSGYPIRYKFQDFAARYKTLLPSLSKPNFCNSALMFTENQHLISHSDSKNAKNNQWVCERICFNAFGPPGEYQIGTSRVFLKDSQLLFLEQRRDEMLHIRATLIQKTVRGWLMRSKYQRTRQACIMIQKHWRRYQQETRYRKIVRGFSRLQALVRAKKLTMEYQKLKILITNFQALCRGMLMRTKLRHSIATGQPKIYLSEMALESVYERDELIHENTNDSKMIDEFFDFLLADVDPITDYKHGIQAKGKLSSVEDVSQYQFTKFAAAYFVGNATPNFTKTILRTPLLNHTNPANRIAAVGIWITILRFMGDLSRQRKMTTHLNGFNCPSVMTQLFSTLARGMHRKDRSQQADESILDYSPAGLVGENVRYKMTGWSPQRKAKSSTVEPMFKDLESQADDYENMLEKATANPLDQLHFIIGHGILRPELRDEILCQICKQLSNNPNSQSTLRGWILLSLCVSCFPPSSKFIKYLRCFIRHQAPKEYIVYCEQRLNRTLENGARTQPPSHYEVQATKQRKPLVFPVTFMNGTTQTLVGDSATNAHELCEALAKSINLRDKFGFSLYIALQDKVCSLGSTDEHVLDAISQCEQYAKEIGAKEQAVQWRLFFRKEIFTPWHNPAEDPVATDLIYQQVTRGVKFGEYRCNRDEDLAQLIAYQYFLDYGFHFQAEQLKSVIQNYIPDHVLDGVENMKHAIERWVQIVLHTSRKCLPLEEKTSSQHVQENVVAYCRLKWPLLFSRFYEAYKFAGPKLPKNEVIVAVNWTGIYVVDDQDQVLLEIGFIEMANATCTHSKNKMPTVTIETIQTDEYSFQAPNAEDIVNLVCYFLHGLRMRSRFVIALTDTTADQSGQWLKMRKGDLIKLDSSVNGELLIRNRSAQGEHTLTGEVGHVECESVYILPTLSKPSQEILEEFVQCREVGGVSSRALVNRYRADGPHTLESFSAEHFRAPLAIVTVNTLPRQRITEELWRHSYEPLTQPLLKKVQTVEDACQSALATYEAIVAYMGDSAQRHRQRFSTLEQTDLIFSAPLKQALLRDEIYCQIIKQLTGNPGRMSVEKGWELMWLCVGLFPPSQTLHKEVALFLRSQHHPVAADCFNRLQRIKRVGSRKYPPHVVEVEAIQRKTTQIFHKFYFPNDTYENIEVDSCNKAKDLSVRIAKHIQLKSVKGFAFFVKIQDKILSLPENEFFFDFIRHLSELTSKTKSGQSGRNLNYQVYFMKKLWVDTVPGQDRQADIVFHYSQELPKYIRGYHQCTRDEAAELAALIYRSRYGDNASNISSSLADLLPKVFLKMASSVDWKRHILSYYHKGSFMSREEAKVQFLKVIYKWPTFGSAFFEVKQTGDNKIPEKLIIAINKNGIILIEPERKDIIASYSFPEISNWNSGNTYFHLTIGNVVNGSRLLCETSMGYKMDDLLTSYITLAIRKQPAYRRH
ncbi:Myosin-VIIa [Trichinella murrelli]|uniref:Myosin-VIIa n=1 Tax=Trichinella murrelli TaxID=144512 RepID=A0A0V0UE68_9BILA|nr:Myosin-VIIa [Trichinella murrelli]